MTPSAPSPRQNSALASSLTTAMTRAPSALPSCTAAMPLPPAAPSTDQALALGDLAPFDQRGPRRDVRDPEAGGRGVGEALGHRVRRRVLHQALLGERAVPHVEDVTPMTWSPIGGSTPSPTAVTTPVTSWPGVNGSGGVSG